jgi:glutamate-1-semialdehyde 2,1-aminomutase
MLTPSRIPFLAAVANLPLIVLGHPETAAGHFVKRFQIGLICPYDPAALQNAAASICDPDNQWFFRRNAAEKSSALVLDDPGQWLWSSLEMGAPIDDRFERLMPR